MAYVWRGRGPRTRGGSQRGGISYGGDTRYTRSDNNMFSCLRGKDGGTDHDENSSSTDSESLISGKSDKSQDRFREVRHKKKRKLNSSSGDASRHDDEEVIDYQSLPPEEKLNIILSKVSLNEGRFKRLEHIMDNIGKHKHQIANIESAVRSQEDRIRLLEYKSIDLEARSRRNNLLFYGLSESRNEVCKNIIGMFVYDKFQITIREADISRAHRVGQYNPRRDRPIMVAFQSYNTAEDIIKQGYMLKNTNFGISRDYPAEINRARKTIWPEFKRRKSQNPSAKIVIAYPAKLIVNGHVVQDMFPEWDTLINGSRIDLGHPSQQSFVQRTGASTVMRNEALPNMNNNNEYRMEVTNENDASLRHEAAQQPLPSVSSTQNDQPVHDMAFKTPVSTRQIVTPKLKQNQRSRSLSQPRTRASRRSASQTDGISPNETENLARTDNTD